MEQLWMKEMQWNGRRQSFVCIKIALCYLCQKLHVYSRINSIGSLRRFKYKIILVKMHNYRLKSDCKTSRAWRILYSSKTLEYAKFNSWAVCMFSHNICSHKLRSLCVHRARWLQNNSPLSLSHRCIGGKKKHFSFAMNISIDRFPFTSGCYKST